jgi:hypothetical protein
VSGAKNPYFDPRIVLDFNRGYLAWRLAALRRGRYQEPSGRAEAWHAAPHGRP